MAGRPRGRRCCVPGRRRSSRAARSTATPSSSASTAPRAGLHQGQRDRQGPRRAAVADRQEPVRTRRSRRSSSARGARDGDLMFFGADKAKVVNDALGALRAKIGHEKGFAEAGLEAAVGARFPDVRVERGGEALGRAAPPVHRAHGRPRGLSRQRSGQGAVQGLRHGAERLGDRRRLGAYPPPGRAVEGVHARSTSGPRKRGRSSASCSTRCSTARRRTAASPSASTASSR